MAAALAVSVRTVLRPVLFQAAASAATAAAAAAAGTGPAAADIVGASEGPAVDRVLLAELLLLLTQAEACWPRGSSGTASCGRHKGEAGEP